MSNKENNSNSGCAGAMVKLLGAIFLGIVAIGRFGDDVFRGLKGMRHADDFAGSSRYFDDIGGSARYSDELSNSPQNTAEWIQHIKNGKTVVDYLNEDSQVGTRPQSFNPAENNLFSEDIRLLREAFGEGHKLVSDYALNYLKYINVFEARKRLLPFELRTTEAALSEIELFPFYTGLELNQKQADALNQILGAQLKPTPPEFKNIILFEDFVESINTYEIGRQRIINSPDSTFKGVNLSGSSVIVYNGVAFPEFKKKLKPAGVKEVLKLEEFLGQNEEKAP